MPRVRSGLVGILLVVLGLGGGGLPARAACHRVPRTAATRAQHPRSLAEGPEQRPVRLSPHLIETIRTLNAQAHQQQLVSGHLTAGYNPFLAPAPFEKSGAYNRMTTELSPPPNDL